MLIFVLFNCCSKVDDGIDFLLNFEGVFETSDGFEITLDESDKSDIVGRFSKVGNSRWWGYASPSNNVGDKIFFGMKQKTDNTWEGSVLSADLNPFGSYGSVIIDGNQLIVRPNDGTSYSFTRVSELPPNGGSSRQVLINQPVSGAERDKKIFKISVPANYASLEVSTFEDESSYRNTADLFVRYGQVPTVSLSPRYSWTADCAGLQPNREDKKCVINGPLAGDYYIMLYGYNTYFRSTLKVELVK